MSACAHASESERENAFAARMLPARPGVLYPRPQQRCKPHSCRYSLIYNYQRKYESGGLFFPFVATRCIVCAAVMVSFTGEESLA